MRRYWWEESGIYFQCAGCGRCCGGAPGFVWMTAAERAAVARELGIDGAALRQEYLTRVDGGYSVRERENYDCYFFERNSMRCKIYKVRPLQCRLFPFWPSMLKDKKIWNYYMDLCPGMNKGKYYPPELIKRFLNLPLAAGL
ncbi:MAG: YkgJ family cysteine cluster protein [Synergistaceae bacterium]|nr:YkgJ family cysteine cluster protein [Synergistaceae bacterium]